MSRAKAKVAIREAKRLGMIEVRERRRPGANSLTNVVTVVDRRMARVAQARAEGGGVSFETPTDNIGLREGGKSAPLRLEDTITQVLIPSGAPGSAGVAVAV